MKILAAAVLLAAFVSGAGARAQKPATSAPDNSPDVVVGVAVIKYSWSKERLNWERDPFGGAVENFDEMRVRTRNEKRVEDAKRGGNSVEENRVKREAKADAANIASTRQNAPPPRYVFLYKASLKNAGTKTIKQIDWDYIFFDRDTRRETGRLQITSDAKIAPGKSKELSIYTSKPPTTTVSAHRLDDDDERRAIDEQVVVTRIVYTDGTVWQRP